MVFKVSFVININLFLPTYSFIVPCWGQQTWRNFSNLLLARRRMSFVSHPFFKSMKKRLGIMLKFDVVYKYTKYLFFDCVELSAAMGDFFVSTLYACHIFFLSLFAHSQWAKHFLWSVAQRKYDEEKMFQVHSQRDLKNNVMSLTYKLRLILFRVRSAWHDNVEEFIKIKWSSCKGYNGI